MVLDLCPTFLLYSRLFIGGVRTSNTDRFDLLDKHSLPLLHLTHVKFLLERNENVWSECTCDESWGHDTHFSYPKLRFVST